VLRREDTEDNDLVLVDPMPETTLFDLGGLQEALAEALNVKVDVKTPGDLPERISDRARVAGSHSGLTAPSASDAR